MLKKNVEDTSLFVYLIESIITKDVMKRFIYLLTTLLIFTYGTVKSETFETNYNHYSAFAGDDENFYIGLHNGFVVQNIESGEAIYYNSINSNLGTNYIDDIAVHNGTVYITGPGGLYTYADGTFKEILLGSNGARKLHFVDDILWTFDGSSIYKYDGVNTQKYDIGKDISYRYEIARIDIHNKHIWISMFSNSNSKDYYYSQFKYINYRFAALNLENNELNTFTPFERGFESESSIPFQTISNNEVWVGISDKRCFIYNLELGYWRQNGILKLIPEGYEFEYRDALTDNNGDIWFSIIPIGSEYGENKPAVYSYKTNTITMKFKDKIADTNFTSLFFKQMGDDIFIYGHKNYYIVNGDSIVTINRNEISEKPYSIGQISKFNNNYYGMISKTDVFNKPIQFINLISKEKTDYALNVKSILPIPAYDAYLKDNNTELIMDGKALLISYEDYILHNGNWLRTDDSLVKRSFYENNYDRFENGNLVIKTRESLIGLRNGNANNYNNINKRVAENNVISDFKIFEDKMYVYGYYKKTDNNFNTFISVMNRGNSQIFQYNDSNSCLTDFSLEGGVIFSYVDSVSMSIEIDNKGNIWVLTRKSLFKIDENLNCEYIDNLPRQDHEYSFLMLYDIVYSKNKETLFGVGGNTIYNLNSNFLDTVNVIDQGLSNIKYFGACSDGNVYVTTETGGLYRVKNIRELIPIEVVPGKIELGIPINHVSYFKDTLYVSTDVGLFKVDNRLTSVEDGGNELSSNLFYPNPSTDYINIEATNQNISISSMTGTIVNQVTGETRIDISDLPSGVYFVRIGDRIKKLIKY
ncbi:MAG: hypothetical protein CVV25_10980 [Ignavibacteriae bacterium HGW-Ignavibacteriae-4]|jgi:hypothetical protein|nr:MAG: hypothetical protein CVV25_10980 [Ignavibacteriae bacterium HGW-Ignavibacteriae-4]